MTQEDSDELTEERIEQIIERKIKGKDNEEDVDPLEKKVGDLIEKKIEEKIDQKLEEKENKLENIDETGANNDQDLEQAQEEINNSNKISRRSFLKKFGLGAIGFSAMTLTNPVKALDIRDSSGLNVHADGTEKLNVPATGAVQVNNVDLEIPDGNIGVNASNPSRPLEVDSTSAIRIPVGNTSERPSGLNGDFRLNSSDETVEAYFNGSWKVVGSVYTPIDASGGSTVVDKVIDGKKYRIHAFENTGNSSFEVNDEGSDGEVDILVVGGGGGGGYDHAGGGGGGEVQYETGVEVNVGNSTVTVGEGGGANTKDSSGPLNGDNGGDSTFDSDITTITALGGGGGGGQRSNAPDGGCGGGAGHQDSSPGDAIGSGFGYDGGSGGNDPYGGGGGGGAGEAGQGTDGTYGGDGGDGYDASSVFGTEFGENGYFGGGGGGNGPDSSSVGSGGLGGGGDGGGDDGGSAPEGGQVATGGGGGGQANWDQAHPKSGGSGIVLIRYPLEQT